ncbi:MAG TPA: hypothetical protein VMV47_10400 [Bacteroidales bacterium]|nr:hypothetical protein [Bacteroidales bacterium]
MDNTSHYGYSQKTDDPTLPNYKKNSNSWPAILSLILAMTAVTGFIIAEETSSEMENPESLYIGLQRTQNPD